MASYLRKYGLRPQLIDAWPEQDLGIVVVIPASNEPDIHATLSSLYSCGLPECSVEVIVIVNASENAAPSVHQCNERIYADCINWQSQNRESALRVYAYLENDMPSKHAGVGLARKIGMDEAVRRLEMVGNPNGVIACMDADTTCAPNYLSEIYAHFRLHPKTPGCSIQFKHPLFGTEYSPHTYLGAAYYELHLRYYNQAMRATGYPHAFHTVGSSMAVRVDAYVKQGGMNKRKAGEDFYFLHKVMLLGNFTELHTTTVFPSPRGSERVPFGTGKAINEYLREPTKGFYTYNLRAFEYLHTFFKHIPEFYLSTPPLVSLGSSLPYVMIDFLDAYFFDERMEEIRANSSSMASFEKRFFVWFNAFMILKFVHFVRDNAHPNVRVERASLEFLRQSNYEGLQEIKSTNDLLEVFRSLDRTPVPAQIQFLKD